MHNHTTVIMQFDTLQDNYHIASAESRAVVRRMRRTSTMYGQLAADLQWQQAAQKFDEKNVFSSLIGKFECEVAIICHILNVTKSQPK